MSDFDELDGLLDRLRQPATPAELASETEMVDLMATTHRHAKGTTMFSSRRARVATLIAAGVIGFGGVAAAGPAVVGPDDIDEYVATMAEQTEADVDEDIETEVDEDIDVEVDEETTTTVTNPQETTTKTVDVDANTFAAAIEPVEAVEGGENTTTTIEDPYPDTDFNEAYCVGGEDGNHGQTVSAVARDDREVLPEAVWGTSVTDAAHSMCGKFDKEESEDPESETAESEEHESEVHESEDDESEEHEARNDKGSQDKGNQDKGNHGKGNPDKGNQGKGKKND